MPLPARMRDAGWQGYGQHKRSIGRIEFPYPSGRFAAGRARPVFAFVWLINYFNY